MCHLAARGATHFLVVCPASVVINWKREVERHTLLEVRRLHLPGTKREAATQAWVASGGVAVTTFEALRAMPGNLDVSVAMMVVDEAHYAKNPNALRTQAVSEWVVEIVSEAADGGRKVIVFSYFRDVLETVIEVLAARDGVPGIPVVGPLTGDIPSTGRQAMMDELTNARMPAVLVAQIQAGGVGLNIQAASAVIIAEPQLTPSMEEQAIARAHRMGQVRPVDVRRLLCEDSVDQRILELLADKRETFDEYARRSDMANAAPDAVGTRFETELRHAIVAAERERLKAA